MSHMAPRQHDLMRMSVTAVPNTKLFVWGGRGRVGDMCYERWTSRSLFGLVCPSRTSERGGLNSNRVDYCMTDGPGPPVPWVYSVVMVHHHRLPPFCPPNISAPGLGGGSSLRLHSGIEFGRSRTGKGSSGGRNNSLLWYVPS